MPKPAKALPEPNDMTGAMAENFPLYGMPGHLIRRLQQASVSVFIEAMLEAGLDLTPVQFAALSGISAHPGLDQISLAGLIAYDRTTIGGVIDRLEAKTLVQRRFSPDDRRVRNLYVAPEGRRLLDRVADIVQSVQVEILNPLSSEERATFMSLLGKLVKAKNERTRVPMRPLKRRRPAQRAARAPTDADQA